MDFSKLMGNLQDMQSKMKDAQSKLGEITAEGESGAGMVKALVNGNKQLIGLQIDDELVKPDDKAMMQDLIVAAVNQALVKVDDLAQQELKKSAGDVLGGIPGFDMSKL